MMGKIFNIQRFCTSDGPGIRTTVFFKGCPLKCLWCHNPESQKTENQILFDKDSCVNCLKCVPLCESGCHIADGKFHNFDRRDCIACGKCLTPHCSALEISGYDVCAEDVLKEVLKDKAFYDNSAGGITLSGGEPLYQAEFCLEILRKAKDLGLHTAIETCGFASKEVIKKSAEFVDVYLFDFKESNPERHKAFTGVDNKLILENLRLIDSLGKAIILRCPIIPGFNDTDEHFLGISEICNELKNIMRAEIEPYHSLGENKYSRLQIEYTIPKMQIADEETVNGWIQRIQKQTDIKVIKA